MTVYFFSHVNPQNVSSVGFKQRFDALLRHIRTRALTLTVIKPESCGALCANFVFIARDP